MNSTPQHTGLPSKLSENARLFANHLSYQNDASNAHISLGVDVHPCSDLSTVLPPSPSIPETKCLTILKIALSFSVLHSSRREMYYCIIKNGKHSFELIL
ncbi:hypothetical protein CEXT_218761 [Caerostris extrusa]|uniref:Uncharacterized protein n=1 Tax=Caerostris extrusa TaxID=172846 RepID=A0AAV4XCW8_CAEEX|nr:hypothetical protein CEXT_218761 [Caerostris extrusa]